MNGSLEIIDSRPTGHCPCFQIKADMVGKSGQKFIGHEIVILQSFTVIMNQLSLNDHKM
jgi:hypothetical protein